MPGMVLLQRSAPACTNTAASDLHGSSDRVLAFATAAHYWRRFRRRHCAACHYIPLATPAVVAVAAARAGSKAFIAIYWATVAVSVLLRAAIPAFAIA